MSSTFEFCGDDSDFDVVKDGGASDSELPVLPPSGSRYQPAAAAAAACALHWVAYAAAVSAVRCLLGASHEDLRLRLQQLCRILGKTFFFDGDSAALTGELLMPPPPPFEACERFPADGLFVCADLPPLAQALQSVNRAMMQVAVKDTTHGPCDCFYDTTGDLMSLLVNDKGVVLDQAAFESAFGLEWVPE